MRRVVSLYLPAWSTDRLRRQSGASPSEAALPDRTLPLVTAHPDHGRKVLASVDAAARALGLRPDMTVTKARSLVPDLAVVDADPTGDLDALKRLALWAGRRFSPFVAPDPPDGLWLDITGCQGLFDGELPLVKQLFRRIAASDLTVQIAVADTPGCAHAVARHVPAGRPVVIDPGDQRRAMALLPIASLRLAPDIVEGLRKLGFDRVEQLLGQPRGPLAKRFGRALFTRLDQAIGGANEAIEPLFPREVPRVRRGLLEPIGTADAFMQVIRDLSADLAGELTRTGRGARRLDLYFHRVDGHVQARRVGTARATRDPGHIAKLLAPKVETIDPGLGIETMILVASLTDALGAHQSDLARDGRREPDLGAIVDALSNRFGHQSLYRVAPRAAAMPERTIELTPALGAAQGRRWADDLPRPGRLIEPPEPIDVIAMLPDHPPRMFVWRRKRHTVVQGEGPERLHGEWWIDSGVEARLPYSSRDYFQVEVDGGGRYWIFRLGDGERAASGPMRWFIHGAFA